MVPEFERCYRAIQSRDARFDGWFFVGVRSTGIYCRPSCPARTPSRHNVEVHPSAASAQRAGFRACKRCRPDAVPGSPAWDPRRDVVARAMRLIADGMVDREGVIGLARVLGYSERQVHRQLVAEVGAGPIALARAQRAQTARILVETTDLRFADIAFASGFASVRQFNDTIREIFAATPTELRRRAPGSPAAPGAGIALRLALRSPFAANELLGFLAARAVGGVETVSDGTYRRVLALPYGTGIVALHPQHDHVRAVMRLDDLRDLTTAVTRCRRLLDLDADPVAVSTVLHDDLLLRPLVRRVPGRRVPGAVDGAELAVRVVLGQHVSVASARAVAHRLVLRLGKPLTAPDGTLTHHFPEPAVIADADPGSLGLPSSRARALQTMASELADGRLRVDAGVDRDRLQARLESIPGIGAWTAASIVMRGTGDPDAFVPTDLGVRRAMDALGGPSIQDDLVARAERWRPWRAYATLHLWGSLTSHPGSARSSSRRGTS